MTEWKIARLRNQPAVEDETGAWLDDQHAAGVFGRGWFGAWQYIAGNASPGDTVTVLEDDPPVASEDSS